MSLIAKIKNQEKKVYLATIVILVVINVFLQINLRKLKSTYGDKEAFLEFSDECKRVHEIIDAQLYQAMYEGRSFPVFSFSSLGGNLYSFPDQDYTYSLIMLFSLTDCNVCIEEEMKITEAFYQKSLKEKMKVVVFVVGYAPNIGVLARFKRINNFSFPLLYDRTDTLRQTLQLYKTPLTFLIHNATRKIVKAHHPVPDPVPEAQKLSKNFIQFVSRLVAGNL